MRPLPDLLRVDQPRHSARRIVGVGQKMYLTYRETVAWLEGLRERAGDLRGVDLFVLPTFPALAAAGAMFADSRIFIGAQDMHWHARGPYTGEVSPLSLVEVGCTFVEIGHAERRALFGESDETVRLKTSSALEHGLVPVICVGEDSIMPARDAAAHVLRQTRIALGIPGGANTSPVVVAYEPVWAIGARASAPVEHVKTVVAALRDTLDREWGGPRAILYGGSVSAADAGALIAAGADGLFVGRAALDLDELCAIAGRVANSNA
jgi:triosephosphate isomerase